MSAQSQTKLVANQFNGKSFRTTVIGQPMQVAWSRTESWLFRRAVQFVTERCPDQPATSVLQTIRSLVAKEICPLDESRVKFYTGLGTPVSVHCVDGLFSFNGTFVSVEATMETTGADFHRADVLITPAIFEKVPGSKLPLLRINMTEAQRVADSVVTCLRPRIRAAQRSVTRQRHVDEKRAERAREGLACLLN